MTSPATSREIGQMFGLLPDRLTPARRAQITKELGGAPEFCTYSWSCGCKAQIVLSDVPSQGRRLAEFAATRYGWTPGSTPGVMRCPACTTTGEPGRFGGSSSDGSNRYGSQMARAGCYPSERWVILGDSSEEKLLGRVADYVGVVVYSVTRGRFDGAVAEAQRLAVRCLEGDVEWWNGVAP